MKERLESAAAAADSFAARWPIEAIQAIESAELGELVGELADLRAAREEGRWWAFLLARTDSENPHVLDVQAWVDGRLPRLDAAIRHFELGWSGVADERAAQLIHDEAVLHERHYLLSLRRFKPFLLSALEERALQVREASASTAWASLRGRVLGGLTATFDDGSGTRTWSLAEIQGLRAHSDRALRRGADLLAPGFEPKPIPWNDARRRAVAVLADITPNMGVVVERFFSERRIDAEPRYGKPYGAMCVWPSTHVPGFIVLNWSGTLFDLVMLTHELGHGAHFALASREQSDNSFKAGIALSEVPSTFAQLRLVEDVVAAGGELARPMLTKTLDSLVGAVFIQVAFARYEQKAYGLRARGQALTHDRLSDLCEKELAKVWGDGMTDELGVRRTMWAPPPHFIHERFYTYSYAFAFLLAIALLARSRERGFGERYERFLAAGGSASPEELMHMIGVDLRDPRIWEDGFNVIEGWLDEVSALSGPRG
jgi:oligoendopeptidase F